MNDGLGFILPVSRKIFLFLNDGVQYQFVGFFEFENCGIGPVYPATEKPADAKLNSGDQNANQYQNTDFVRYFHGNSSLYGCGM